MQAHRSQLICRRRQHGKTQNQCEGLDGFRGEGAEGYEKAEGQSQKAASIQTGHCSVARDSALPEKYRVTYSQAAVSASVARNSLQPLQAKLPVPVDGDFGAPGGI